VEGKAAVEANVTGIARACACSVDQVLQFLQRVRESAIQATMTRKRPVTVNLSVGALVLYPNQTLEFRSAGAHAAGDQVSVAPSSIGEIRSQYIEAGRTAKGAGARLSKDAKLASLLRSENSPPQDYTHLSSFLKQHISAKRRNNAASKSNSIDVKALDAPMAPYGRNAAVSQRYNNALIERAARDIHEIRSGLRSQEGSDFTRTHFSKTSWVKKPPQTITADNKGQVLTDRRSTVSGIAARRYMSQRLARKRDSEAVKVGAAPRAALDVA
jgi:hypothetical protein